MGPGSGASSSDTQLISGGFSVEGQRSITAINADPRFTHQESDKGASMGLAEFVERRFIPEYAMQKRAAGRSHFRAILKHIFTPERIDQAFRTNRHISRARLVTIQGWPYLDALRLSDVTSENIQCLIGASMERGYSAQTVVHIRNVLRLIFSHAIVSGEHSGTNPAAAFSAPPIAPRPTQTLTLLQLKRAMELMRYPEKHIALFALST